jgi:hypothetical protein
MAVVNGYCTVDQVRAELSDDGGQLPDALLEKAVNAASRAIDQWTGRRFWQDAEPVARRYRPTSRYVAEVDDISTTTGLVVETDSALDASWSTAWTVEDDFELGPANADAGGGAYAWWELAAVGSNRFLVSSVSARHTLRVTARWGWSEVPVQVTEATILRAIALFKRKETPFGVADFGEFGPVRIGRQDADVIDLLRPFQRVMAA